MNNRKPLKFIRRRKLGSLVDALITGPAGHNKPATAGLTAETSPAYKAAKMNQVDALT
jgi:hypothetical protein